MRTFRHDDGPESVRIGITIIKGANGECVSSNEAVPQIPCRRLFGACRRTQVFRTEIRIPEGKKHLCMIHPPNLQHLRY